MPDVICIKVREKLTHICKVQAKDFYTELANKKVPSRQNNIDPTLKQCHTLMLRQR